MQKWIEWTGELIHNIDKFWITFVLVLAIYGGDAYIQNKNKGSDKRIERREKDSNKTWRRYDFNIIRLWCGWNI